MSHSRSFVRPCAEFPGDNPALHDGVSWVCLRVGAPLRPIARARLAPPEGYEHACTPVPPPVVVRHFAPVVAEIVPAVVEDHIDPRMTDLVIEARIEEPEIELGEFIAAGAEATAPPPSVFALSVVTELAEVPDVVLEQGPSLEALALEFTPSNSEVRAVESPDELELDDLDGDDDGFAFDGGSDVDFSEAPSDSAHTQADSIETRTSEPSKPSVLPVIAAAPPSDDAFQAFVAAVQEVAHLTGAALVASALPALFAGDAVDSDPLAEALRRAPGSSATVFDHDGGQIRLSRSLLDAGVAWTAVLRGHSGDLSSCGTTTLDGWAGDILRALGVGADGNVDVRRELRKRGVAAFGMLLAA